jgi:HEAT repeat protein
MSADAADRFERQRIAVAQLSDDELLAAITSMAPLPDVDDLDPVWTDDANFERAELLLAIADSIGERRLVRAIQLVYERAAPGDVFEMLRGLRHGPELAVAPDWGRLVAILRPLARHPRAGTRRWAIDELGVLRDRAALPELLAALDDPEPIVRDAAITSLAMVALALNTSERAIARDRLERISESDPVEDVRASARHTLAGLG